jgi:hypothetical protein
MGMITKSRLIGALGGEWQSRAQFPETAIRLAGLRVDIPASAYLCTRATPAIRHVSKTRARTRSPD